MEQSEFLRKYTSHLNEKQLKAVQTIQGPVLLLAVPGSGKTTVLVNRLGYMLFCEGIAPQNILTLTYTVAATKDMARRFASVFGTEYEGTLEFRTINGICAKIIQKYAGMIGKPAFELVTDEKVTGKILTDILRKNLQEYPTESDVKGARTLIAYCKNMLLTTEEIEQLGKEEGLPLSAVYREYNAYLRNNSLMDYDDQMIYAYRMLKGTPQLLHFYQEKYRYICVDEAQDTSKIQHIIISLLAGKNGNLFMVGDEDQSIYGFRAAYPEALLHFENEHPDAKVLVMDRNYRSNAKIVAAADMLIQNNKARHEKHMVSTRAAESEIRYIGLNSRMNQYNYLVKVAADCAINGTTDSSTNYCADSSTEYTGDSRADCTTNCDTVCGKETAVLYRDNESALPLVDQLERQGIPYRIKNVEMSFFTHRVVMDVTNILRFALNPYSTELFMNIYFKCQTFLKKDQAEQVCRMSAERNIPVLDAVGYVGSINGMVKGKCRAFQTHLANMLKEAPSKALFRIETPLGYEEYLKRNNMDGNKLFILKALAGNEVSIGSFLARLEYLQNLLKNNRENYGCNFILSTIHSSKGLEYDQVYLMDVCDGVFPNNVVRQTAATPQEKKEFEEERRLFYVGMTRAKDDLHIFTFSGNPSCFVKEIKPPEEKKAVNNGEKRPGVKAVKKTRTMLAKPIQATVPKGKVVSDFALMIGERVVQDKYGAGVVSDVDYDAKGRAGKFAVLFDSGEQRVFEFPMAFQERMRLESGQEVKVWVEKE